MILIIMDDIIIYICHDNYNYYNYNFCVCVCVWVGLCVFVSVYACSFLCRACLCPCASVFCAVMHQRYMRQGPMSCWEVATVTAVMDGCVLMNGQRSANTTPAGLTSISCAAKIHKPSTCHRLERMVTKECK